MRLRAAPFCCLLVAAVSGCGSADEQSVSATAATVEATTAATTATTTAAPPGAVLEIPVVTFAGEQRDQPVPYFGTERSDGGVQSPAAGFEPAAEDAPFCSALEEINARPQPRDDFEEVVVAEQFFNAIEPVVPAELAADFAIGLNWLTEVVESGSFLVGAEPQDGDALLESIDTITTWVDQHCLGR